MKNRISYIVYRISYGIRGIPIPNTKYQIQNTRSSGFTLVETLVAISLLTIAIIAPMSLTVLSLAGAMYAKDQLTAYFLAQEGVEAVRSVRDGNILSTVLGSPTATFNNIPVGGAFTVDTHTVPATITSCPNGICPFLQTDGVLFGYASGWASTRFKRSITVTPVNQNELRVQVTVAWLTSPFQNRQFTLSDNLYAWVNTGGGSSSSSNPATVWVDDSLPNGASPSSDGGDGWTWVANNPLPFSGTLSAQSNVAAGEHQHYFSGATATLSVGASDTLFTYVYLDPSNPPTEIMLQWNDGSWEHRAYWGANNIGWGVDGTVSRMSMGAIPATGQWVKLSVPASTVGLGPSTLNGMAFTTYDGRATWDYAGKQ